MNHPRIHVVGSSPRSGTTLLFELLTSCFEIEKFGDHEVSLFHAPREVSGPYASKKPTDLVHATRVIRWDKALHVIYMQRDPRDIVVSEHGSRRGEYWCDFNVWQHNQRLVPKISDNARFYECRYENLVRDPDAEQARIAAAFPFLRMKHRFSEFEQVSKTSDQANLALKGVRAISSASVGTWRKNLPRVAAQLIAHPEMAEAVVSAGYASDTRWTESIQGITPDHRESVRALHNVLRGKGPAALAAARILRRSRSFRDELLYALGYRRAI
ncbi:sulfotransferase domain-containing protein [Donghicola sp. C2-DW-16]|uniref:Sulfotransferase domain-containing protein n=1 Tax=Donghicola mangrovi TaxID=2729614 RepID=A0ABX2PES3_9RHOB|nr:sulfotransferase domain-containing protein [Donghicola mangrovi]NVO28002.1 sulfotransferase domain-containing protein [Donghicola mangrovi]